MDDTTSPIESRLDWLTLTCTDDRKRLPFFNLGLELVKLAESGNLPARDWHWKGYDGRHAKGCTFGRRGDSDILQLSGLFADQWFDVAWEHADNCTRLDLAVTVKVGGDVGTVIGDHERECLAWKSEKPRTLSVGLIKQEGSPQTLYLGKRVSDQFGRIYDKFVESGEPQYESCVRYEVEIKGALAERACAWLASSGDRADCICDYLHKYCVRRGLRPKFGSLGRTVPINTIRPVSDSSTRLAWLASSCAPVVKRLLPTVGTEPILAALGFPLSARELVQLGYLLERDQHRSEFDSED